MQAIILLVIFRPEAHGDMFQDIGTAGAVVEHGRVARSIPHITVEVVKITTAPPEAPLVPDSTASGAAVWGAEFLVSTVGSQVVTIWMIPCVTTQAERVPTHRGTHFKAVKQHKVFFSAGLHCHFNLHLVTSDGGDHVYKPQPHPELSLHRSKPVLVMVVLPVEILLAVYTSLEECPASSWRQHVTVDVDGEKSDALGSDVVPHGVVDDVHPTSGRPVSSQIVHEHISTVTGIRWVGVWLSRQRNRTSLKLKLDCLWFVHLWDDTWNRRIHALIIMILGS